MASLHFILQGKGGVGKSFVASTLAQRLKEQGWKPLCFDTDPVNQTFHRYKALDVELVTLLEGDEIIVRNFDAFIEQLIELGEDDVAVVDNGAASFLPLCGYMVDNGVVGILKDAGHEVCIHSVVTGGGGFQDAVIGLDAMINHFPEARTFVWKNGYFGGLDVNGTAIESTKYFRENKERIAGIIEIPQMRHDTYGEDISDLLKVSLTFDQGIRSKRFGVMKRQRLKTFWRRAGEAMSAGGLA